MVCGPRPRGEILQSPTYNNNEIGTKIIVITRDFDNYGEHIKYHYDVNANQVPIPSDSKCKLNKYDK